jgi:hypothetical protein
MRNRNNALADALLKTQGGQHMIVQVKEFKREQYQARVMRYSYLKDLVREMFPKRRDVQFHAMFRPEGGQSRLWEIAGDEALTSVCANKLKWAGTSEQAEIEAKVFINPR